MESLGDAGGGGSDNEEHMGETVCICGKVNNILGGGFGGGGGNIPVRERRQCAGYYNSPQSFLITFSYSLA